MSDAKPDVKAIFCEARTKTSPEELAAYLEQACGGDDQVRQRVEALLRADRAAGQFLGGPPSSAAATLDPEPIAEGPGSQIGPYKLLERLGEGTFGVVYMAEQREPVRRKVALKILKPGMDTKHVIARFEAEEQALALMDHPNIARVFDAGAADSGRPYFVMELVKGRPITDYCDAKDLTTEQRLELFISVCHAVQHAHQKGIIHRDIKPSNVLVEQHDDKPVVKVIDFGVAKALHQPLTEKTLFTGFGQMVGTVLYMSPEQAELNALDVDTRSDIYSLGVLLYELLTGVTPFDRKRLLSAAFDDMRRIIREEEPPKPSTRLSTLGDTATELCKHRQTEPKRLSALIRGDVDWIVMKALEKDRGRRYEAASGFAADIRRYLDEQPIEARPPSFVYRFRKLARRNRAAVVMSALVLSSLIVGMVATSWQAKVAQDANRNLKIEVERKKQALRRLAHASYERAVAEALTGDTKQAQQTLADSQDAPYSPSEIAVLKGLIAFTGGRYEEAVRLGDETLATDSDSVGGHALLAAALCAGFDDRWERVLPELRRLSPQSDADRLLHAYGLVLADPDRALAILQGTPRVRRSPVGLLIRAEARCLQGVDRQDPEMLEKAIQDFEYVQDLFHDNQGSLGWHLLSLAAGIELARAAGRREDEIRYTQQGRLWAEKLALLADSPVAFYDAWLFYRAIGDSVSAARAIRGVASHPGSYSLFLAAHCLQQREIRFAADEFAQVAASEHKASKWRRLAQSHLVPDSPGRVQRVRELVEQLVDDPSPLVCRHALSALCLVSSPDEITMRAQKALMSLRPDVYAEGDLFNGGACVEYLAGRLDEHRFLENAGEHGYSKANAHFTIAMQRLAARNRQEALEHFKLGVATNTIGSFDYELARAYLTRMKADAAWPDWMRDKVGN